MHESVWTMGGGECVRFCVQIPVSACIDIRVEVPKFVSRAGLKLEKALDHFSISVEGLVCLDSGLSTGGFTDCLLQRGASQARF